jgi:hypothetical protein
MYLVVARLAHLHAAIEGRYAAALRAPRLHGIRHRMVSAPAARTAVGAPERHVFGDPLMVHEHPVSKSLANFRFVLELPAQAVHLVNALLVERLFLRMEGRKKRGGGREGGGGYARGGEGRSDVCFMREANGRFL